MDFFDFIIKLTLITLTFTFVWKWFVAFPASLILGLLKIDNRFVYIIKSIGVYFLISIISILLILATQDRGMFITFLFYLIGGFTLLLALTQSTIETQKKLAELNSDYEEMTDSLRFNSYINFGGIILFIVILFIPNIALNKVTLFFIQYNILFQNKLPNWVLIIIGGSYLFSLILYGTISISTMIITLKKHFIKIVDKFKKTEKNNIKNENHDVLIIKIKDKYYDTPNYYIKFHFLYQNDIYKVNITRFGSLFADTIKSFLKNNISTKDIQQLKSKKEITKSYNEEINLCFELISCETPNIIKIVKDAKDKVHRKYYYKDAEEKDVKKALYYYINESLDEEQFKSNNITKLQVEKLIKIVSKAKTEKNHDTSIVKIDNLLNTKIG